MSAGHIVIAGGTGLLGQKCQLRLADLGYATYILTRGPFNADKRHIHWNPATRQIDTNIVDGARAVIALERYQTGETNAPEEQSTSSLE